MDHRTVSMLVGLTLALGMGGLLLAWLNSSNGSGLVGLLFIMGSAAGIVVAVAGALADRAKG